jgi:WD40 repeat protein
VLTLNKAWLVFQDTVLGVALHGQQDFGDSIAGHIAKPTTMSQSVSLQDGGVPLDPERIQIHLQQATQSLDVRQGLVHCPITALAFYTSSDKQLYILAGEDRRLKVYSTHDQKLRGQLRVFADQPIHGISVSSSGDLLVWGAASVAIVPGLSVQLLIRGEDARAPYEAAACDWIYDGRISPYDSGRGVVVTAHNEVVPFTVGYHEGELRPKPVWGGLLFLSRPILYSTAVQWTAPDEVLVVAGTVFGEIVVWKCHLGREVHGLEVLFVLSGHEGSIFGVAISPEVELVPGLKQRFLASCSDDRTIRIWDITENPEKDSKGDEKQEKVEEVRETGFGGNNNSEAQDTATETDPADRCLAVAIGHASRVWHVRFACNEAASAGPIEVCSFGEDTTMQNWRLDGGTRASNAAPKTAVASGKAYTYALEHVEKTACHNGKHIWSCAVTSDGPGRSYTVTGGADGKVTLLRGGRDAVAMNETVSGNQSHLLSLDDVMLSLPMEASGEDKACELLPPKSRKDGFLRYAFLSKDRLLVSTISGRLLLGDLRHGTSWSEVATSDATQQDLKGYNVVKAVAPGTAIIGSTGGHLYVFREAQGLEEIAQLSAKVADVLCIPDGSEGLREELRIFVTVLGSTEATIFTLDTKTPNLTVKGYSAIALHIGFVVTSVGVCGDLLLLGSRKGAITVYQDTAGVYVHQTSRNDCKTKGGDAVTSITTLPPLNGARPKYVLTTCRDGKYRIYEVQSSTAGSSLQLRHETTPPLGPMLEGARLVLSKQGDLELVIYGFRSANFVVWNETRQQEIASVACGGAHRTFDYFADPADANKLRFVYTKASAMGIFSQDEPSVQVVRQGGHGREIRAIASDASWTPFSQYVATGAEDTCIRIWECSKDLDDGTVTDIRCLAVLQKHTAGLQALKWEQNGYLLSSAGAEEFFVWKITSLESEYKGLAVMCEAVYPFRTPDGDLRIMDFDSRTVGPDQTHPEARILLTMVFSNSVLKTYRYTQRDGFTCKQTGKYTGACLTQVKQMPSRLGQTTFSVITGSTDGTVALWKPTAPVGHEDDEMGYQIVLKTRAHENSVKSLELVRPFANDTFYVCTGGDDNALSIHALTARVDEAGRVEFEAFPCSRVRDAHAAAVTGVKLLRTDGIHSFLVTISNDQRLKIWRMELSASGSEPPRVALLYNAYSALADPGGLEIIDGGNLMVAGVGIEIWDFFRGKKVEFL